MTFDETTIRTYLAWYGADIAAWPEELKHTGRAAQQRPELAPLFAHEKRFENFLSARRLAPAASQLAERIISASLSKARSDVLPWHPIAAIAQMLRPSALVAMLVLGFAIGFGALAPAPQTEPQLSQQSLPDDEGAML